MDITTFSCRSAELSLRCGGGCSFIVFFYNSSYQEDVKLMFGSQHSTVQTYKTTTPASCGPLSTAKNYFCNIYRHFMHKC